MGRMAIMVLVMAGWLFGQDNGDGDRIRKLFGRLSSDDWLMRREALEKLEKLAASRSKAVIEAIDRVYSAADAATKESLERLCRRVGHLPEGVADGLMRRVFGEDAKDSVRAQEELFFGWLCAKERGKVAWRQGVVIMHNWLKSLKLKKPKLLLPSRLKPGQKSVRVTVVADGWFVIPRSGEVSVSSASYRLFGVSGRTGVWGWG